MVVPAFVAAVQSRSAEAVRAALAPSFKGKSNGRDLDIDGQVRLLESFWAGFPDGQFVLEPTGGSGRHVITWTFAGTHGGLYAGVPPTGAPVSFAGFIIAVSDKSGILSLDWKWDPKVFTRAVLGPDNVGTLEVKDTFRADPSKRWMGREGAHGLGGQRGKKPKPRQGKPGQPQAAKAPAAEGAATAGEAATAEQGQRDPSRRRRRGRGPRAPSPATAAGPSDAASAAATATEDVPAPAAPAAAPPAPAPANPDGA